MEPADEPRPEPFDLVIRSRRILSADGWLDGGIGIRDGRIVRLGVVLPAQSTELIDVGERIVLPGLVDTHAHVRDPGFSHKEDWEHATRAAVVGGVTTLFDMPNVDPVPNTAERFRAHRDHAAARSAIDFGHHASATIPTEIPGIAASGASGFKVFMKRDVARSYPHMPGTAVDDHARLFEICEAVAATGRPLLVHPDDQGLAELFAERAWATEGRGFRAYARALRAGDGVTLDLGIATMLALQRATGVRLHLLHVSTPYGWALIRHAKAEGQAVTAEVNPFHLTVVNDWDTIEQWGPYALGSWIPRAHADATWEAVLDGTADVIGSDHTPHLADEKEPGWTDMFSTPGGSPTIQHYLSLLLTAVHERKLTLERLARLCASEPARLMGLNGVKGTIEVGADADLVVVDPDRAMTIRREDVLSKCGWTILDGREVVGVPTLTLLRGRPVARDGEVLGRPGEGRWVGDRTSPAPAGPSQPWTVRRDVPRSIWLEGDGIRVHGLDWSRADRASQLILLLHGVGGNALVWNPVARHLRARLDGSWRILALDGRDGGQTDHPEDEYEPERFAADLLAAHDQLGRLPLTLVGHSRGGWLAAWFAERHPERLDQLVLVDPARLAFESAAAADRFYDRVRAGLGPFPSRDAALQWAVAADPDADWNEWRVASFLNGLVERADGSVVGRLPATAVDQLRAARELEDSVGPNLSRVDCPVLLLVADRQSEDRRRDKLAYAEGLPNVRVEPVAGSHFLHTDAPDVVAGLIADVVAGDQAAAPMRSSSRPYPDTGLG